MLRHETTSNVYEEHRNIDDGPRSSKAGTSPRSSGRMFKYRYTYAHGLKKVPKLY
jgi:hypothetical protein